jgi:hypothetical protein
MRSLALLAIVAALVATGCRPAGKTAPAGVGTAPAKTTYSRDELRTMVMGKTMEEVIALIGRPEKTTEPDTGMMMMQYSDLAIDPGTGKARVAFIHLKNGKVNSVGF